MQPKRQIEIQGGSSRSRRTLRRVAATSALFVALALLLSVAAAASGGYDPSTDGYSMYNLTQQMGASAWWDAGYTGAGIDVAVIDTGVTQVAALAGSDKVVYGPDLSIESQSPSLRNLDSYGHGTFMAGLIAGHDSTLTAPYSEAPASAYRGVAPDARVISVKVGTTDGGADVTQVIAAIDWVVQHAHDPGFNIRVISLSYGTNSTQSYTVDPLAFAAEQAWKQGIVVVAAAGNTGFQRGNGAPGLADPAYDPYIIGVGGFDTNGTAAIKDDVIGAYSASSNRGSSKKPDFVAPGSHIQGLRVPGSYIDDENPSGILDDTYMRGSGTSEATAITAGAIALILQRYPSLTPDQVKAFIQQDAQPVPSTKRTQQGAGELNLAGMLYDAPQGYPKPPAALESGAPAPVLQPSNPSTFAPIGTPASAQSWQSSTGTGSLETARGTDHLTADGVELTGQFDIFGHSFDSAAMATAEATGSSWSGGTWNGNAWSGSSWSGNSWSGSSWSGSSWSGSSWSGVSWSGSSWSGSSWSGASWSGSSWSAANWLTANSS